MPSKKRTALFAVAAIFMGALIGVFLFEAGTRVLPGLMDWAGTGKPLSPDPPLQATSHVYHPGVWYGTFGGLKDYAPSALEPFSEDYRKKARHNSHGFRTPEYTIAHPPDTFRVVVIGDSFTYGDGVAMKETFPRRLAGILEKRCPGARVEVISLGICGSRLVDNVLRLRAHARSLAPDLVVIQLLSNDLEYANLAFTDFFAGYFQPGKNKMISPWRRFIRTSRALSRIFSEKDPAGDSLFLSERKRVYKKGSHEFGLFQNLLATLKKWSRKSGTPLVLLWFPDLDPRPDGNHFGLYTQVPEVTRITDSAKMELEASGLPYLDLTPSFAQKGQGKYLCVSESDSHPNPLGHGLAAGALAEFLLEQGLAPCQNPVRRPGDPGWAAEAALRRQAREEWKSFNADYGKQREFFEKIYELHPDDPWVVQQFAWVNQALGNRKKALKLYAKLPELSPGQAAPWSFMAECADTPGEKEKYYLKQLSVLPGYANALESLGNLYEIQGREKEACRAFTRLARSADYDGQFETALKRLKRLGCLDDSTVLLSDYQGKGNLDR